MGKLIPISAKQSGLTVRAKNTKAEIILYGAIGSSWDDSSISAKQFSDEIKKLGEVTEISVRINSPGGDVFDGISIYNRLKQHKAKVIVYVDGMAASIASIIMMAGDEIIVGEGSQIMIHKPWTFAMGNASDLDATINRLDDVEEQMISIYSKRTGIARAELRDLLAKETWMSDEESVELKFADKKAEDITYRMAASADVPWVKKAPVSNTNSTIVKNKLNTLMKRIEGIQAR
jgi:ATP-dependent Clp protease protease subunit